MGRNRRLRLYHIDLYCVFWLRGQDLNLRPSGYEPDELPGCSTPRQLSRGLCAYAGLCIVMRGLVFLSRFGGDLLSHVLRRSTIGAAALNGRVRDGIGCFARAMTTKPRKKHRSRAARFRAWPVISRFRDVISVVVVHGRVCDDPGRKSLASAGSDQAYRAISTGQLNALLRLHLRPIDVVVFHGPQGDLVLKGASRLDAFSGYPVRS